MNSHTHQVNIQRAFLGHIARRLADLVVAQGAEMLGAYGLRTPSSSVSMVLHLRDEGATTVTELAKVFGHTHQMSTQRIAGLVEKGLVERTSNKNDKRSSLVSLTKTGREEASQLTNIVDLASIAFEQLFEEIECDLAGAILAAERHLQADSLLARMKSLSQGKESRATKGKK